MTQTTSNPHTVPALSTPGRAGYLQFDVLAGDCRENLSRVAEGLARLDLAGPGIVLLPELWATGFAYERLAELARQTPDMLKALCGLAGRYNVHLAGSLPEAAQSEAGTAAIYNTLYVVNQQGIAGCYRKQQLFAPMEEDRHFTPGDNPKPVDTELGRLACLVCYDLRFPELTRLQAAQGAALLLVSAQWPAVRKEHWRTLLQARAIENQMFVVGCNRCGITDGVEFGGHSMIVAPDGAVLQEAAAGVEEGYVEIAPALLESARLRFKTVGASPYRAHDRDKIAEAGVLRETVKRYKALGRKVVFTNGCFDILHEGHVTYLEAARRLGDCLIVGLNSDASIRAIKGPDRPVNREQSRARLLAALGCVDHVVLFSEETPHTLITTLLPGVLVKGGDWPVEKIVGGAEVTAAGGTVVSIPLVENFSTTSLIDTIRGQVGPAPKKS